MGLVVHYRRCTAGKSGSLAKIDIVCAACDRAAQVGGHAHRADIGMEHAVRF
jgi:hypothetical protein